MQASKSIGILGFDHRDLGRSHYRRRGQAGRVYPG
jgi:hypothetical protein